MVTTCYQPDITGHCVSAVHVVVQVVKERIKCPACLQKTLGDEHVDDIRHVALEIGASLYIGDVVLRRTIPAVSPTDAKHLPFSSRARTGKNIERAKVGARHTKSWYARWPPRACLNSSDDILSQSPRATALHVLNTDLSL